MQDHKAQHEEGPQPGDSLPLTEIALRFLEGIGQSRVLCDYALSQHRKAVNGAMNLIRTQLADYIVDEAIDPVPPAPEKKRSEAQPGLSRAERMNRQPGDDEDLFA